MAHFFVLNEDECAELFQQDPATKGAGGFQSFLIDLQGMYRSGTQEIRLTDDDIIRIQHFAFDFKQGGWQDRLVRMLGRHLGPDLGRG
jgi:hypothetical protein